jgi:hypothetical protein
MVLSESLKKVKLMIVENMGPVLEDIGEQLLLMAEENAAKGYGGLPYAGGDVSIWEPRAELTKELYELRSRGAFGRPYSQFGMDTGYHRLIDSLRRFGEGNIFEKSGNEVIVGTSFKFAKLLEEGGQAPSSHVGFSIDGTPKKWLVDVFKDEVGVPNDPKDPNFDRLMKEVYRRIDQLWNRLKHPRYLPGRPYLKPALWFMRDKGKHIEIAIKTLETEMRIDLSLEKIRIEKE